MKILPGSFEFQVFYTLMIIVMVFKFFMGYFLFKTIIRRKKQIGKRSLIFLMAIFFEIVCLFVSRIFFMIFDFGLTYFDSNLYYLYPNIIYWKVGMFISGTGVGFLVFIAEKFILNFRTKGFLAYIMVGMGIITLIYPINSAEDFELISFLAISANIGIFLLPFIYMYIGYKSPEIRKHSLFVGWGFIIYGVGALIINESIVSSLKSIYGGQIQILLYFLFITSKIVGLSLVTGGSLRLYGHPIQKSEPDESIIKMVEKLGVDFSRPDEITEKEVAFYREQTTCLVCKDVLIGFNNLFICSSCRALYCRNCAKALSKLENMCWACNSQIDNTLPIQDLEQQLEIQLKEPIHKGKKDLKL
jgi:hypothetical protein